MKAWGNLLSFAWAAMARPCLLSLALGMEEWFYPWIFKGTRIHWGKIQSEIGPNLGPIELQTRSQKRMKTKKGKKVNMAYH